MDADKNKLYTYIKLYFIFFKLKIQKKVNLCICLETEKFHLFIKTWPRYTSYDLHPMKNPKMNYYFAEKFTLCDIRRTNKSTHYTGPPPPILVSLISGKLISCRSYAGHVRNQLSYLHDTLMCVCVHLTSNKNVKKRKQKFSHCLHSAFH